MILSQPETVDTVSDKLAEPPPGLIVVPCGDTYNTPKHTVVSTVLVIAGASITLYVIVLSHPVTEPPFITSVVVPEPAIIVTTVPCGVV